MHCTYPSIRKCATPSDLLVNVVQVDEDDLLDLGLGQSIYSEGTSGVMFKGSQGTRQVYLTETVELAYEGRDQEGSWGFKLVEQARAALINGVGWSLVPLYCLI